MEVGQLWTPRGTSLRAELGITFGFLAQLSAGLWKEKGSRKFSIMENQPGLACPKV